MSSYLTIEQLKLRIDQVQNRLAELSRSMEKIAFQTLHRESYEVRRDYINRYGANAEKEYDENRMIAIKDYNTKIACYQEELKDLNKALTEKQKHEAADSEEVRRIFRHREIERLKEAERAPVHRHVVEAIPVYRPDGVGVIGGFVGYPKPMLMGGHGAFVGGHGAFVGGPVLFGGHHGFLPSPGCAFMPAHSVSGLIRPKTSRR